MRTIAELLTDRKPRTLPPTATALDAARRMQAEHIGAILIVDDAQQLVGCFSERDLTNRVVAAGRAPADVQLHEVMTRELFTATPEDRIHATACEMQERHIRHLPVVVDGQLIAVLGLRDMQRELLEATRGQVNELTRYIRGA
ncbi:MAG: CBS domain-containing protein [Planctomycetota bacterium]